MPFSKSFIDSIPLSFASVSIGTPDDSLEDKLKAISRAGFQAIELGFPDLQSFASKYNKKEVQEDDYENLCSAGVEIRNLCKKHKLEIMMLQPFSNFEGWAPGSKEREDAFSRVRGWIKIMQAVGTEMLQVGSSDSENISTSHDTHASDLRELADMLAEHKFRLAYENWCWATAAPTWMDVWTIVQKVNRPNIGLCLDTFQTVGSEYADPTSPSGLLKATSPQDLNETFRSSLRSLTSTIPAEKIYLLQISDAYKPSTPLENSVKDGLRPRGRWSHDFRPYPFNGGEYTEQCVQVARAVLGTGARCWFSVEVFDGGRDGKGKEYDFGEFARGAMASTKLLLDECVDA